MRYFYLFILYGLEIDRYMATTSGNREFLRDTNDRISRIEHKLDLLEINASWK